MPGADKPSGGHEEARCRAAGTSACSGASMGRVPSWTWVKVLRAFLRLGLSDAVHEEPDEDQHEEVLHVLEQPLPLVLGVVEGRLPLLLPGWLHRRRPVVLPLILCRSRLDRQPVP